MILHHFLPIILLTLFNPLLTHQEEYDCIDVVFDYEFSFTDLTHPSTKNEPFENLANYKNSSQQIIEYGKKLQPLIQKAINDSVQKTEDECDKCLGLYLNMFFNNDLHKAGSRVYKTLSELNVLQRMDDFQLEVGIDDLMGYNRLFSHLFDTKLNVTSKISDVLKKTCASSGYDARFGLVRFNDYYMNYCRHFENISSLHEMDKILSDLLECSLFSAVESGNDAKFEEYRIDFLYALQTSWLRNTTKEVTDDLCSMVKGNETLAQSGKTEIMLFLRDALDKKLKIWRPYEQGGFCPAALALQMNGYSREAKEKIARVVLGQSALLLNTVIMCENVGSYKDDKWEELGVEFWNNEYMVPTLEFYAEFLKQE